MVEMVKFTKKQRVALKQLFSDANRLFNKDLARLPYLYHESERASFVTGYVVAGLKHIINSGCSYLDV